VLTSPKLGGEISRPRGDVSGSAEYRLLKGAKRRGSFPNRWLGVGGGGGCGMGGGGGGGKREGEGRRRKGGANIGAVRLFKRDEGAEREGQRMDNGSAIGNGGLPFKGGGNFPKAPGQPMFGGTLRQGLQERLINGTGGNLMGQQ